MMSCCLWIIFLRWMDGWIWWSGVGRSFGKKWQRDREIYFVHQLIRWRFCSTYTHTHTWHRIRPSFSHYWLISTSSYRIISMCEMGVRICYITSGHTFPLSILECAISWSRGRIYLCNVWLIYFFDLRPSPFRWFMSSAAAYFPLIEMKLSQFIWLISYQSVSESPSVHWPCRYLVS